MIDLESKEPNQNIVTVALFVVNTVHIFIISYCMGGGAYTLKITSKFSQKTMVF